MLLFKNILFLGVYFMFFSQTRGALTEEEFNKTIESFQQKLNSDAVTKELGLPSFNPFRIKEKYLHLGSIDDYMINGTFTDVTIKGLTDFTINVITSKKEDLSAYVDAQMNKIETNFKFNGCIEIGEDRPICLNKNISLEFEGNVLLDVFFVKSDETKLKVDHIDMHLMLESFDGNIDGIDIKKHREYDLSSAFPHLVEAISAIREALATKLKYIINKFDIKYDDVFGESGETK